MTGRIIRCALALMTYLFLYGCIDLGPDYHRPDLGIKVPESYDLGPTAKKTLEIEDRWWEIWQDRELNQLVDDALLYNWDIKQAASRILEVRARYVTVRSARFPSVDVGGLRDRREVDGGDFRDNSIVDTYELNASGFYEADLQTEKILPGRLGRHTGRRGKSAGGGPGCGGGNNQTVP